MPRAIRIRFMTCGAIAERYPDAVKAIVANGHEIAGHGYHHEVARNLTQDQEHEVMTKTIDMIRGRTTHRPVGWRCRKKRRASGPPPKPAMRSSSDGVWTVPGQIALQRMPLPT